MDKETELKVIKPDVNCENCGAKSKWSNDVGAYLCTVCIYAQSKGFNYTESRELGIRIKMFESNINPFIDRKKHYSNITKEEAADLLKEYLTGDIENMMLL